MILWRVITFQWVTLSEWFKTLLDKTASGGEKNQRGKKTFSSVKTSRKLWFLLQCVCKTISGYYWLPTQQRIENENLCRPDISPGSRNWTWIKKWTGIKIRKQDFLAICLKKLKSHAFLESYKANYFINGTGCIGEQRHTVLLQNITLYKRHCIVVQRCCNSWTNTYVIA